MWLICSSFFSILVNGSLATPFTPSRDSHQGYPLSPFLYILMVEGLRRTIHANPLKGNLKGINLHRGAPPFTHHQFVYDTLLMVHPSIKESKTIKNILKTVKDASRSCVNMDKSQHFFFNTTPSIEIPRISRHGETPSPSQLGRPFIEISLKSYQVGPSGHPILMEH